MALKEERLAPKGGVCISTECYVDEKRLANRRTLRFVI